MVPQSSPASHRLVVSADDFGKSSSVNRAVAKAHDSGILTAASLMAAEEGFDHAVTIARARPSLSIGLHVTLCDGRAALESSRIPDLVGPDGRFAPGPAAAGLRYSRLGARCRPQLEAEIEAQFDRLERAGIRPDHVDGHHHLQVHPAVFEMVCRIASARGVAWVRVPREILALALRLDSPTAFPGHLISWIVFESLAVRNRRTAARWRLRMPERVHGLFQTGRIDANYLSALFSRLATRPSMAGSLTEVYTHPDDATEAGRRELEALLSPQVKETLVASGFLLTNFAEVTALLTSTAGGGTS
ncbi:MAG: ChbG/HpnK family deacetylase [Planctomycetes bacterium]|nr:ChbG/HpnK family deacetylase [Planctomycetota bacterium]